MFRCTAMKFLFYLCTLRAQPHDKLIEEEKIEKFRKATLVLKCTIEFLHSTFKQKPAKIPFDFVVKWLILQSNLLGTQSA